MKQASEVKTEHKKMSMNAKKNPKTMAAQNKGTQWH